jgi:predicted homoserine dehydrogenase-like protein
MGSRVLGKGSNVIILDKALERRAAEGNPVRVAIVGGGYMARGIAAQILAGLPGLSLVGISNRHPDRAWRILEECGVSSATGVATVDDLERELGRNVLAVVADPMLLCRAREIDVVIETTGEVEFGAHVAVEAIENRKHVVLVNAELDATVGPMLKVRAERAGVVVTNTDGDEPGVSMNLLRYVRTIGMRPVLAGNIKGFIDPHRTPETQKAFADSVGQQAKMITSFADGTKLAMETTIVANAAGFRVARRGMYGHKCAHVKEVLDLFDLEELLRQGVVDYVLGAEPGSGAFVVGYCDRPLPQQYLKYFKMGDGPLYLFYMPWHLPHAEAPLTAARAAIFHDAAVSPLGAPSCDVVTMAKRDLDAGEVLDGIGGFTCYGTIENFEQSRVERLLPMGLSEGCEIVRPVPADRPVTYEDVTVPPGRLADELRREQDQHFRSEG